MEKLEKDLEQYNSININKNKKFDESLIPIEKYNNLLEQLNKTEKNFEKIQKENGELIKYKKFYIKIKEDNNPININEENSDEEKKNEDTNDEIDYYKKKFEEVQTLLNVLKEGIKKILMKINIPKKDREEIKQLLKLCDFSNEETLMIFGDKKI